MSMPRLTHLQFLVLSVLLERRAPGKEVRSALGAEGVRKSGPAFYQLMARIEDDGLVRGWYEQEVVEGQIHRERCYEVTAAGRRAWRASCEFYRRAVEQYGDGPAFA